MKEDQLFDAFSNIDNKYVLDAKLYTQKHRVPLWIKLLSAVLTIIIVIFSIWLMNGYRLLYIDGEYYVDLPSASWDVVAGCEAQYYVSFSSIDEMIHDIRNGDFTSRDYRGIRQMVRLSHSKCKIPNLDNLYEPLYPDTCNGYTGGWWGSTYWFWIDLGDTAGSATLDLITETYFNEQILENQSYDYCLTVGNRQIYVLRDYFGDPSQIRLLGTDSGQYFQVYFRDLQESPSDEWLSSFGLIEYQS